MRGFSGVGLVVVGFLFLYMAVTGKLDCLFQFVQCVTGNTTATNNASGPASAGNGVTGISFNNGTVSGSGNLGGIPISGSFHIPVINFAGNGASSL